MCLLLLLLLLLVLMGILFFLRCGGGRVGPTFNSSVRPPLVTPTAHCPPSTRLSSIKLRRVSTRYLGTWVKSVSNLTVSSELGYQAAVPVH